MTSFVAFSGGRLDSLTVISGSPLDTTSGGYYDSEYADSALDLNNGAVQQGLYDTEFNPTTVGAGNSVYWHASMYANSIIGFTGGAFWQAFDSSNNPWLRILCVQDAGTLNLQYNSGTTGSPVWTTIGTVYNWPGGLYDVDIAINMPASGPYSVVLYVNQLATVAAGLFTPGIDGGQPNISYFQLFGNAYLSEWTTGVNKPSVGVKVKYSRATAAGTYSQWTGSYTDVNQPGDNTSTVNQATSVGLKQSYPMGNVTVPAGYSIATVFYWSSAKNTGGSPSNIQALMHYSGTDYISSDLSNIGLGFGPVGYRYDVDPSTSAPWTQAGWNTPVELGWESAA